MNIMTAMRERIDRLAAFAELDAPAAELPASASRLSDASVLDVMRDLADIANDVGRLQAVVAGVVAHRSQRDRGRPGLAATQGHANPAALVQAIGGGTRAEALRQLRVGAALLEKDVAGPRVGAAPDAAGPVAAGSGDAGPDAVPPRPPWHDPLRRALLMGRITTVQHDAVRADSASRSSRVSTTSSPAGRGRSRRRRSSTRHPSSPWKSSPPAHARSATRSTRRAPRSASRSATRAARCACGSTSTVSVAGGSRSTTRWPNGSTPCSPPACALGAAVRAS